MFVVTATGLRKVYQTDLPDKCCPLFRLEESLFVPRELIDLYLQPKFTVQEYMDGKQLVISPLSGLTSILDIVEQAEPCTRIIISASAGVGKSAFCSHPTRGWCQGQTLTRYQLLYLLLPRYIDGHLRSIVNIICTDLKLHPKTAEADVRRAIKANAQNIAFIMDGYEDVPERAQRSSSLYDVISGEVAKGSKVVVTTRPHCVGHIAKLCRGSYVHVALHGFTKSTSKEYIQKMCAAEDVKPGCEARRRAAQLIMTIIPRRSETCSSPTEHGRYYLQVKQGASYRSQRVPSRKNRK